MTATGGSGGSSGGLDFRPITGDDFAKNYRPVDRSGIPEKKEEILKTLPDVDIDNLVKEVPDVSQAEERGMGQRRKWRTIQTRV